MQSYVGLLSEEAALNWPHLALAFGKVQEALGACEAGTKAHTASAALWSQAIILLAQQALQKASIVLE